METLVALILLATDAVLAIRYRHPARWPVRYEVSGEIRREFLGSPPSFLFLTPLVGGRSWDDEYVWDPRLSPPPLARAPGELEREEKL